ncbi:MULTISPECIES: DUF4178 domain-containing protein [unclassified Sphingomonas]|uniref:DUF4178 domain-containing protein n=1 Tax=Novosphingobium rhizosphaerae TaxID=1551649 RepID=UPI0015CB906A
MTLARAVTCPSCGGSIEVRAAGYTVTLACRYCGSVLDVAHEDVRLITAYKRANANFAIELGTRGTLFDVEWEAIGALRRRSPGAIWQEYLLFNPYAGYRWLVVADGEWQFGTMLLDRPDGAGASIEWRGKTYQLDDDATVETTTVLGEFYWRVSRGDRVQCATFACGSSFLSREAATDEVTWTHLVPVDRRQVEEAFAVRQRYKPRAGLKAIPDGFFKAPGTGENDLPMMFLMALGALLMIGIVQDLMSRPHLCANNRFDVVVGAATATHKIGTIEVTRPWQFVTIQADSNDFSNRWVDLDYSLVNRRTQQSIDAYGIVEYYTGTDSDGRWTEGSHHGETQFAGVPRGSYDVYVDTGSHGWPTDPPANATDPDHPWSAPDSISMWFNACTGGHSWGMFWIFAILLFGAPCLILWRRHRD